MNKPSYKLYAHPDLSRFDFTSSGKKTINKVILYTKTPNSMGGCDVYNLGFGDITATGTFADKDLSESDDALRVMNTVMASVIEYTSRYNYRYVYFSGRCKRRLQLYNTCIQRNCNILLEHINIYCKQQPDESWLEYDQSKSYTYFLIIRK